MKLIASCLAIALLGIAWLAVSRNDVVRVTDPCNTFVSEYAPTKTPTVVESDGQWWLTLSYTPAPNEEASRIYRATLLGERTLEITATGRLFRAANHEGRLRMRLHSKNSSVELLKELCFKT